LDEEKLNILSPFGSNKANDDLVLILMCHKSLHDDALLFLVLVITKVAQVVVTYSDDLQLVVISIPNLPRYII
jgi:hypothetical protein